ncbi:MAG: TRAP transporter substrate-binding protein DctP [Elusimicrobiota bacterium]
MIISSAFLWLALSLPAPAQTVVKCATLAPEGSTWMRVLTALSKDLEKETGAQLKFKFYPGGVAGDEKDVVKKIRIGQLHAAGFTGVGLGEIAPELRLLDAPWLFRSRAEVEAVRSKFSQELNSAVEKGGFVLLGWTDLGSVYVFSKNRISAPEDMKRAKMWVWEGDPIAGAAYKALNVNPIPLSVVDVMQSLQTGMIDAVYGPPLGVIALQWHSRLKHVYPIPMAQASGAMLISKKFFDTLPPAHAKALLDLSGKHLKNLNDLTLVENEKALDALKSQGLDLGSGASFDTLKTFEILGASARRGLAGRVFSQELLEKFEKELLVLRERTTKKT